MRIFATGILVPVFLALGTLPGLGHAATPAIRLHQKSKSDLQAAFEVTGLDPAVLKALARQHWQPAQWTTLFAVYVRTSKQTDSTQPPPFLGTYQIEGHVLRFAPRFPLVRGVRYRAVFHPGKLPGKSDLGQKPVTAEFLIPKTATAATTVVEHVYPSADMLPENQLKFYLHFSAPMSQGDVYRHIKLLRASGKQVELPFLELERELWDSAGRRFTLYFDPGRIKRGLKPREELGPVLENGKSYTLVIDRHWLDAEGNPLKQSYRKTFKVSAPQDRCPDPRQWRIQPAPAGARQSLTVIFPQPMEHALLLRAIEVIDADGKQVPGIRSVTGAETRWHFRPEQPWRPGKYHLVVESTLEDLAGNNLQRPFEVDVFRRIERRAKVKTIQLPFQVAPPKLSR